MSGNPYKGPVYSPVPVAESQLAPTSYPPSATFTSFPPSGDATRPNPNPLQNLHDSNNSLPNTAVSNTFTYSGPYNYSDSPKPWRQSVTSLHYDGDTLEGKGRQTDQFNPASDPNSSYNPLNSRNNSTRWSYSNQPLGLRKFSRAWLRYHWNVQVSNRRLPRLLYGLTGIVCLGLWIALGAAFASNLQSSEGSNAVFNQTAGSGLQQEHNVLFFMNGQLNSFDPHSRDLNLDWSAFMVQGPLTSNDFNNVSPVSVEKYGNSPIVMWRDTVARADQGLANQTSQLGYIPFRIKDPFLPPTGFLGVSDFDSINTDIGLSQGKPSIWTQPEFGYPWDVFTGSITWVAANNDTITSTGRPGSGVLRLYGAILTDGLLNFKVKANTNATCLDDEAEGCELIINITLQRTGLVKFCVVVVVLINWIVTIAIFLVTGEALLLNRSNILDGTDILAVCFSALFALPTVRSLLPGVPGDYGALIDLVGILPNVIIVALCTTFFANSRLRRRINQQSQEEYAMKAQ